MSSIKAICPVQGCSFSTGLKDSAGADEQPQCMLLAELDIADIRSGQGNPDAVHEGAEYVDEVLYLYQTPLQSCVLNRGTQSREGGYIGRRAQTIIQRSLRGYPKFY